tara:strand:- start:1733 stop:1897 length:165 start_codon:yes stop_codon:yes gene_type:complete
MKRETLNCLLCFILGYVVSQMMTTKGASSCCGGDCTGCKGGGGNLIEGSSCHND